MKKSYTWIVLLLVIVLLLGGGTFAYRILSKMTAPTAPYDTVNTLPQSDAAEAPDFTVYDGDGNALTLLSLRGKPVLVNFWATWCGPCKSELPALATAFLKYGDKVDFLLVNLTDGYRDTVDGVKAFLEENGYTFPVYYDTDESAALACGVSSIPTTVLVSPEGKLLHTQIGAMEGDVIESLIAMLPDA
jgi:thiol-disulfide isomerase/thioredoxin